MKTPATYTDNFDFLFELQKSGWSTAFIFLDGKPYEIGITHVLSDPISDLIGLLLKLRGEFENESIIWWDEPGKTKLDFQRRKDQRHLSYFQMTESNGKYEKAILSCEIKTRQFIDIAYFQLLKIEKLMMDPSYSELRSPFPFTEFHSLKRLIGQGAKIKGADEPN